MTIKVFHWLTITLSATGLLALPAAAQDIRQHQERVAKARDTIGTIYASPLQGGNAARATPRIINGEFVLEGFDEGTWEFTASLQQNSPPSPSGHFCGGVLVSPVFDHTTGSDGSGVTYVKDWDGNDTEPRMMLTAAHCVTDHLGDEIGTDGLEVVSGNTNLGDNAKVIQTVEAIHRHQDYDDLTMAHDIAILVLSEPVNPIPDGATPRSIALPDPADTGSHKTVTAAHSVLGWGTTENGFLTQFLMSVRVPFSDQNACADTYDDLGWEVHATSFCAGFATGGFDSCQGDSGGPIIHRPTTGVNSNRLADPVLTGLVSWGRGCGWPGFAGVYADVMAQRSWIEKTAVEIEDG